MPITYNATAGTATYTSTAATTTSIPLTLPGTPTDGDLLILATSLLPTSSPPTYTAPAGFLLFQTVANSGTSSSLSVGTSLWYRRWHTGDPTSYTVTLSAARVASGALLALSGVKDPQMADGPCVAGANGTAATSLTLSTLRTLNDGAWVVAAVGVNAAAGDVTPPGGATERAQVASGNVICNLSTDAVATATAPLSRVWTFSNGQCSYQTITLRPAEAPAATYYVRPDGNDANAGTGAASGQAFATLGRALGALSALNPGEAVHVAPGTYRETVTAGFLNCPTQIYDYFEIRGDPDVSEFPDMEGGPVTWTAYTAGDSAAPATAACLAAARNNVVLSDLLFVGGQPAAGACCVNGVSAQEQWSIERCHFMGGKFGAQSQVDLYSAPLGTASDHWIDRCLFFLPFGGLNLLMATAAAGSGDTDSGIEVRNCYFQGGTNTLACNVSGTGNYRTGGVAVSYCTFAAAGSGPVVASAAGSFGFPMRCIGNLIFDCGTGFNGGVNGMLVEEGNFIAATTPRSNVLSGSTSVTGVTYAKGLASGQALITGQKVRPVGMPLPESPLRNFTRAWLQVRGPGASADDAALGTVAWASPGSALQSDDARATAVAMPSINGQSHYLVLTAFGFAIPGDATVTGIRVSIEASAGASSAIRYNAVRVVKGGVIGGDDRSPDNQTSFATSDGWASFGSATYLWGQTWTPADINASGFGLAVSLKNIHASVAQDGRIDMVNVAVSYTRPYALTPHDLLGAPRPPGSSAVLPAAGCYECGDTMVRDQWVYHSSSPSGRIDGPGYQDFEVPVQAAPTTVSAWMFKNASYTGAFPSLVVLANGEIGLDNDVETVFTLGADTWGNVACVFTPTRAGVATVRMISRSDTSGGGAYIDDFLVN